MGYLGTKPANSPLTSELIPDGLINTSDLANGAVTLEKMSQKMTQGTAVSASGTAVDFTGIPSWAKRITVMMNGVSTSGTSYKQIQLIYGGGTVVTSGYRSSSTRTAGTSLVETEVTTGFGIIANNAGDDMSGSYTLTNLSGNTWTGFGGFTFDLGSLFGSGSITIAGTLTGIRITTVNGTDTFDAGTINIMYEG